MSTERLDLVTSVPGPIEACVRPLDGRPVVWVAVTDDATPPPTAPLSLPLTGEMAGVISTAADLARRDRLPLVLVLTSTGADVGQGAAALAAWGTAARAITRCSGVVPTMAILDGPVMAGPTLLLGLVDLVIATERSHAFVNGPRAVLDYTGVAVSTAELGGADVLASTSGVVSLSAPDRAAATELAADVLAHLPDHTDQPPPFIEASDPADRACPDAAAIIPETATGSYDVRAVAEEIVDDGSLLELRARWAGNIVTALATIDGTPIGIVANQPLQLAGTLDIEASQKAARFVAFCDAFNLPLLTLVDTPGFYPGKDLEWRGMIRHGAQLVYAYGRATVPRVCVILRKSYGGAYIVMDSKTMGNDICFAWPGAEIAVMGAGQAAAILRRNASDEERAAFEDDYRERLLNPYVAAERGVVDIVIDPADTRREVAAAFAALQTKRERLPRRRHGNTPL